MWESANGIYSGDDMEAEVRTQTKNSRLWRHVALNLEDSGDDVMDLKEEGTRTVGVKTTQWCHER